MKAKKQKKTWELTRHGKNWTPREEALLEKLYPSMWAKDLAAQLDRTERAVATKARRMGIRKLPERKTPYLAPRPYSVKEKKKLRQLWRQGYRIAQIAEIIGRTHASVKGQLHQEIRNGELQKRIESKPWSKKDIAYLIKQYKNKSSRELSAILGRTEHAIRTKAEKLNLSSESIPWTAEEINIVKREYKQRPTAKIAEKLGRTAVATRQRAIKLGLSKPPTRWTAGEIEKLRDLWQQGHSKPQIVRLLGKNADAVANQITKQVRKYGLKRRRKFKLWSKEEDAYVIRHYHNKKAKQIAAELGRTRAAVIERAILLKITKPKQWTADEIKVLKEQYAQSTAKEIAEKLGKKTTAVQQKAYKLGLKKETCWTAEEVEFLIKHYPQWSCSKLGQKLGTRKPDAVRAKAKSLGLIKTRS